MMEPPPFEEALRCNVCKSSFNAFRRRHHCRCCGRTLCNEHSSKQIPLPQFGIHSAVRVCNDCFNNSTQSSNVNTETVSNDIHVVASSDIVTGSFNNIDTDASSFSKLDLNGDNIEDSKSQNISQPVECKCGMPLCICQATPLPQVQAVVPPTSNYQRPKKISNVQQGSSNSSSKSSASSSGSSKPRLFDNVDVFFNSGQTTNGTMLANSKDYETSGEGLREAIKNGDVSAVKKLLIQGVDANYCDKQGMSLLHLATVFNHTEITFILMNAGASVDAKNAQGETPLDCAPTMLQYKMRQKMQEAGHG